MCRLHYTILHRPCQALNFLQQTPISAINFIFCQETTAIFGPWPDCNSGGGGHAFPDEQAANGSGRPSIGASVGDDHGGFHSGAIQKSLVYFMGNPMKNDENWENPP